jgi:hypothetical protein
VLTSFPSTSLLGAPHPFQSCWLLLSISAGALALADAIAPEEVKRMRRR